MLNEDRRHVSLTCLDTLRDADMCAAFIRLHPVLNTPVGNQLTRHPRAENGLQVSLGLALLATAAWAAMSKVHKR